MKRVLAVTAIGLAALAGCSSNGEPEGSGTGEVGLPASAVEQIEGLLAEKAARNPAQRKISSALLYEHNKRFKASGSKERQSLIKRDGQGRVLVDMKGDVTGGLENKVRALGGDVVAASVRHGSVRAWLGTDRLETLAADGAVRAIRPALMAQTWRADAPHGGTKIRNATREERVAAVQKAVQTSRARSAPANKAGDVGTNAGSVQSEGSAAQGAERARKFFNTDGTGVKVGVLSDSQDFLEASIASGDLPVDTFTLPGQDGRPGSGEGTAMLEIVHDVAPGAKLFFATAFTSPESFAENIRALRFDYGCDIIVDDVIYYFESPFQDDIIAQAVDDVTADGALYFSSAGNGGNLDDGTSGTWEGDFKGGDALATLPSGYTVHDFGNKNISNRMETFGAPVILHWSDPGTLDDPASSNDYDLFILDPTLRNVVFAATDIQDGAGLPFEFIGEVVFPEERVVVARNPGAQTRAIRVQTFQGGELGVATNGGTYGHNSAANAMGVAAVDAFLADGGEFTAGPTTPVEVFSSDGYRRIFYDRDGRRIRGGVTFASDGGELRRKPEISGADGVSTTLPPGSGLNPFFGTSAAAPHAAAIAALIKSAVPNANVNKVRRAMKEGVLDIEGPGDDRNSGTGITHALLALRQADARPAVFLELGAVTTTGTTSDVPIPGGGGSISVQLVNNGGATASTVRATLVSTTPGVTLVNRNSNYANIRAGESQTNATPFTFNLASTVMCGAVLDFSLTVVFAGNGTSPQTFNFSVLTGRPAAPATYAYSGAPVAIPDDDTAGVDIPIAVGASGAVASVSFNIDGATCSTGIGSTTVGIDHSWVGDVVLKLTSPSGTTVTLVNQAGGALNSGNNFCQTNLVDGSASSIQNVTVAQAPYTGTFAPANAQSAFAGDSAGGNWILNASDLALFDTGTVRAVSIDIAGFDCTP